MFFFFNIGFKKVKQRRFPDLQMTMSIKIKEPTGFIEKTSKSNGKYYLLLTVVVQYTVLIKIKARYLVSQTTLHWSLIIEA